MGAIVGTVHWRGESASALTVKQMADRVAHRGPCGESIWVEDGIGLGHRSDGISPAVARTPQPQASDCGRYRIVCSGRVFNWQQLSSQSSTGDTHECTLDLVLSSFKRLGVEAFSKFNGAYSCAIWDMQDSSLTIARDHFGLKPLYYHSTPSTFTFGSEIKAILAAPGISGRPDDKGISEFLSVNRFQLLTDNTCYQGIQKLQPGCWLKVTADGIKTGRYWNIDPNVRTSYATDVERVNAIREIMVDAIRIRIPEENHFGAALSGGFDSSSIVCVIRHILNESRCQETRLDTFSYNFDNPEADEEYLVDLVSRHANTNHHALHVLQPDFFSDLDAVIQANDGPVVESTALLLYKKMRKISETGINVQFSGIGGDELFQGELNYFSDLLKRGQLLELLKEIRGVYPFDPITGKKTQLAPLLRAFTLSPLRPKWLQRMRRTYNGIAYPPDWISDRLRTAASMGSVPPDPVRPRFDSFFDQSCWDLFYYELVGASAHYHDCAGAPFAVESRYPLMDVRLVEAMFATPREWKITRGHVRPMQKQAMAPFLPIEIRRDHLKKDHHPTVTRFMQTALREQILSFMNGSDQLAREYIDWEVLERHAKPFLNGKPYNPLPLWLGLALERWLQLSFGNSNHAA